MIQGIPRRKKLIANTNGQASIKYGSNLIALDWVSSYALSAMAISDLVGHLSTDILLVNGKIRANEKWQLILFGSGDLGLVSLDCQPAACRCGIGVDIFTGVCDIGDSTFMVTAPIIIVVDWRSMSWNSYGTNQQQLSLRVCFGGDVNYTHA